MRRDKLRLLRNIGIAAHIDAGKTTLTERILYFTGRSHRMGETHTGNSQMDTSKQEIEKGITISSAATHTTWQLGDEEYHLNIIDTPGHVDFMIEVERSLRVLDGMVALFDAVAGVESQTETVWQQAARYKVPVIAMVNKMDRIGADYLEVVRQMRTQLGANALPIQLPIGEEDSFEGVVDLITGNAHLWDKDGKELKNHIVPEYLLPEVQKHRELLFEAIAFQDEMLMDQYLSDASKISSDQWQMALRQAVLNRQIVPVAVGSAYKNKGIHTLLDAVCQYLPAPPDRGVVEGTDLETQAPVLRNPEVNAPFSALLFKIALDEQNRELSFFRVYSGQLKIGDTVLNPRTGKKVRIGRLYQLHANKRKEINNVAAGDIAATVGLKAARTGDTICTNEAPILLESLFVPPPVISMAVEAKHSDQLDKLGLALSKLQLEDPSFKVQTNQETGQTLMLGMGELHLEIILEKLKHDFDLEVNVGSPGISYMEVFTRTIEKRHRLKRQSGGSGLFAEMQVIIGPADPEFLASDAYTKDGNRLQFINKVVGGAIPKEFIPSIATGFTKMLEEGALAGYPIQSLKVELLDGATHSKDSNPKAFEACAMELFRQITAPLAPKLLEPIVKVEVTTPDEYLGNVLAGLSRRRGLIIAQELTSQLVRLEAEVPLGEMFGYINHLRSVSSGRANYSMVFKQYALLPEQLAAAVLADK